MGNIQSIQLRLWVPAFLVSATVITFVFATIFSRQHETQSIIDIAIEHAQTDSYVIAREIELVANLGFLDRAQETLDRHRQAKNYLDLSVVDLDQNDLLMRSKSLNNGAANSGITRSDNEVLHSRQLDIRDGLVQIDNHIISVFSPLTLIDPQTNIATSAILISHYDGQNDLARNAQVAREKIAFFGLVIAFILLLFTGFYNYYIGRPFRRLLNSLRQFSTDNTPLTPKIIGTGEFKQLAETFMDLTQSINEQNRARQTAQNKAERGSIVLDSVFTAIPDLFFILDKDMKIVDYRAARQSLLYVPPSAFLNKRMDDVLPPETGALFRENSEKVWQQTEVVTFEYSLTVDDKTEVFEARLSAIPDDDHIVVIVRNITERKENEDLIQHQAYYDALTGLPNRYLAMDRLGQLILEAERNQQQTAVLFIDLDDFKKINDTLGHSVGDTVLVETARRLKNLVRGTDTIARLGGDEFLLLANNLASVDNATNLATQLINTLNKPFKHEGRNLQISLSIGIALYPNDGKDQFELLRKSDMAMYHAKFHGKNQYAFFTENMNQSVERRITIEENLLLALAKGEFQVHYQPQFSLHTHELIGAEALLRWNSDELGAVSPEEFIPIAEQNGQISLIGRFVIERAMADCATLTKAFARPFRMAINLSPRQIRDTSLLDFIDLQLDRHQLSGRKIEFEITEGVLMSNHPNVKLVLTGLRERGIAISMDDFGTGYSSLSYLQEYSFDVVKIDRSFINNMNQSEKTKELVKAIISMTHHLRIKVLAEGVEDIAQVEQLNTFECDFIQGYMMGKAIPIQEFLTRWSDSYLAKSLLSSTAPDSEIRQ